MVVLLFWIDPAFLPVYCGGRYSVKAHGMPAYQIQKTTGTSQVKGGTQKEC